MAVSARLALASGGEGVVEDRAWAGVPRGAWLTCCAVEAAVNRWRLGWTASTALMLLPWPWESRAAEFPPSARRWAIQGEVAAGCPYHHRPQHCQMQPEAHDHTGVQPPYLVLLPLSSCPISDHSPALGCPLLWGGHVPRMDLTLLTGHLPGTASSKDRAVLSPSYP